MKSFWYFFLLLCIQTLGATHLYASQKFRCDYTYFKEVDGFLKFHEIPSNWHEAHLRCHLEGAKLASPLNDELKTAMRKMMAHKKLDVPIFTGIHSTFSKGDFFSVEGIPLSEITHSWAKNEPDNCNDRDNCIVLLPDGTIADAPCNETLPYMCYTTAEGKIMNACGTTDPGYTYDARTGSCYKFHEEPHTWHRGFMVCAAEGGHLAIINSETEATVIKEIFAKHPPESLPGSFDKRFALVGIYAVSHTRKWLTIHDETIKEAGYDKFAPGEPNNVLNDEYCGSVYRNGMFNDLSCETLPSVFICEKAPSSLMCKDK